MVLSARLHAPSKTQGAPPTVWTWRPLNPYAPAAGVGYKKKKPFGGGRRAFYFYWARLELNQHALAGTRPSTLRVCQFRHEPGFRGHEEE